MKTLQAKVSEFLEIDGWDLVCVHTSELEWWADEIWELRSRWSPEGMLSFVTVLVDPMWEGNRQTGQGILGIGCSRASPQSRSDVLSSGVLYKRASRDEISKFVATLHGFRDVHT